MHWNKDRPLRAQDRVVLIDLAHPMPSDMDGFDQAKQGMLFGITNLKRILLGADIQETANDPAPAVKKSLDATQEDPAEDSVAL